VAETVRASQRTAQVIATLGMTAVALLGAIDLRNEWQSAGTAGQKSVAVAVTLYTLTGIAGAIGLALRKRWSFPCSIVFALACTWAGTVAVIAYAGGPLSGVIGAFVGAGIIGALIAWLTHVDVRELR